MLASFFPFFVKFEKAYTCNASLAALSFTIVPTLIHVVCCLLLFFCSRKIFIVKSANLVIMRELKTIMIYSDSSEKALELKFCPALFPKFFLKFQIKILRNKNC